MVRPKPEPTARRRAVAFEAIEPRRVLSGLPAAQVAPLRYDAQLEVDLTHLHEDYHLLGAGQTVVIIDSGIAYDHQALGAGFGPGYRVVGGWDFTAENDGNPYDDGPAGFHGTHVAGIIAAQDIDHPGIAPQVQVVALRVVDDYGRSSFSWIEQSLRWVHQHRNDFSSPVTTVNLSIGISANATLPESQQILTDELAQLAQDGIFVSVAAGNGYDTHPVTGLSYPASDPNVVAVGSVDSQGNLSDFTRRDARMLLAPGEAISSTVPDRLYSFDGVADDWNSYSGTSQAAPYVAGAAVLLREALQRTAAGPVDATQLVNVLRQTADPVTDPTTGLTYSRINLVAAVSSILGDVPSTFDATAPRLKLPTPATQLGSLDYQALRRVRVGPQATVYQFRATVDGWLTGTGQFLNQAQVEWQLFDHVGRFVTPHVDTPSAPTTSQRYDWLVRAGETYYLKLQGDSTVGDLRLLNAVRNDEAPQLHVQVPASVAAVNLQINDAQQRLEVDIGGVGYQWAFDGRTDVELLGHPSQRLNVTTQASGDEFYFRPGDLIWQHGTNAVEITGLRQIDVHGRTGQNSIARLYGTTRAEHYVSQNGVGRLVGEDFSYTADQIDRVYVFAGAGDDSAELSGSDLADLFVTQGDTARLSNDRHLDWVENVEQVMASSGSGGIDRAFLYGSSGDDVLVFTPESARFSTRALGRTVNDFDRVYVTAEIGGIDRAYLHGSAGSDVLRADQRSTELSGPGYLVNIQAFTRVYAYAEGGRADQATLIGSALDDCLSIRDAAGSLSSSQYNWQLNDFDQVDIFARTGPKARAFVSASEQASRLSVGRDSVELKASGTTWRWTGFGSMTAEAGGGDDIAMVNLASLATAIGKSTGRVRAIGYQWPQTDVRQSLAAAGIRLD